MQSGRPLGAPRAAILKPSAPLTRAAPFNQGEADDPGSSTQGVWFKNPRGRIATPAGGIGPGHTAQSVFVPHAPEAPHLPHMPGRSGIAHDNDYSELALRVQNKGSKAPFDAQRVSHAVAHSRGDPPPENADAVRARGGAAKATKHACNGRVLDTTAPALVEGGALQPVTAKLFPVWTPKLGAKGMPYSDRYNVTFAGAIVVERSRDPETDLARVLLARGHTGTVTM